MLKEKVIMKSGKEIYRVDAFQNGWVIAGPLF